MDLRVVTADDRQMCDNNDGQASRYVVQLGSYEAHCYCTACMWTFLNERVKDKVARWQVPAQQYTFHLDFMRDHADDGRKRQAEALIGLGTDQASYTEMDGEQEEAFQISLLDPKMRDAVLQAIVLSAGNVVAIWHDVDGSLQYEGSNTYAAYSAIYFSRNGGCTASGVNITQLATTGIFIPFEIAVMVGHDQLFNRMRADFDEDVHWNAVEGSRHFCVYCGSRSVSHMEPPATHGGIFDEPVSDDELDRFWADRAEEHYPGCEWIATRAHTIEVAAH